MEYRYTFLLYWRGALFRLNYEKGLVFCRVLSDAQEKEEEKKDGDSFLEMNAP